MIPKLSNAQSVDALAPRPDRYVVRDGTVSGLEIRVHPDGAKVWSVRYRNTTGDQRRFRIGQYPRMSLHAARVAANRALRKVDDGLDPQGERQATKAKAALARKDSIEALTTDYIERHAKPRKRTWAADQNKVNRVILPLGGAGRSRRSRGATAVSWCRGSRIAAPAIQANRVAALLSRLFRFAVDEELIPANIAAAAPEARRRVAARPEGDREVKPYDDGEIAAIWTATARSAGRGAGALPARPRHRAAAQRDQRHGLDRGGGGVVGDSRRAGEEQPRAQVYLTSLARKELALVPKHDALVFAGYRGKRQLAALNVDIFAAVRRRKKPRHAMRDTVATGMADAGVAVEDISRVLNHAVGPRVTGGYNAYTYDREKQTALEVWADRLDAIIDPRKSERKVLALRPKGRR